MKKALLFIVVLLAAGLTSCTSAMAHTVSILAIWTAEEAAPFKHTLDELGVKYTYVGTRAASQVLASDIQKGTPPDIAILPSPNDLARYLPKEPAKIRSGELHPVGDVAAADQQPWLLSNSAHRLSTVTVQMGDKSFLWYRPPAPSEPPGLTWEKLTALKPVCLGLESLSTTGWPATDWIEDILLHQSGFDFYQQWAQGKLPWTAQQVRDAWQTWGAMNDDGVAPVLTDFHSPIPTGSDCRVLHQTSDPAKNDFVRTGFPTKPGVKSAMEVAADSAGLFTDSPEAAKLVGELAAKNAKDAAPLLSPTSGTRCFDASDLMPAPMTDAFYRAALAYQIDHGRLGALLDDLEKTRVETAPGKWFGNDVCREGQE
ncbi:extracellular solute-binding protein [Amycolatopsis pigmentata]|uniref:Extracellular solute-binding protein n=1 Tax=Amycolatopsis pigmentata TaxID=450801 RepID=A0ABW5FXF4_9PSEU